MPTSSKEVQPVPDFEAIDATVRMPLATGLARDKGPWAGDRIAINLTRSGQLRARGHQFSLRALGLYVRGLVTARKLDAEAGQLRVLLRVDGDAPWKHVQQLLTELHRSGVERVEFGVRGAATGGDSARDAARFDVLHRANEDDEQQYDAFFELLLDEWAGTRPSRFASVARSDVDRYQLDMLAEREVDAEWGPDGRTTHVRRPLDVRYEWEGKPYYDVRALIRVLVAARGAAFQKGALIRSSKLRVVVSASEKVPAKYVIAALARAKALHWGELWYFRRTEASEAAREALSLPYPKSNDLLQVRDGLEAGPRVPSEERR
jgi:biopolymer transport protein ExbD